MCPDCESKFSLKKMFLIIGFVMVGVFITDHYASTSDSKTKTINSNEMIVYKDSNCGCCTKWAEHMRENGFTVTERPVDDLDKIKDSFGVPKDKRSCHTAVMGKYIFEGHIPAESIKKFLKSSTDLKGLTVPGMRMGSPGMEYGSHKSKFTVLSFDKDGKISTFENI